MVTMNTATSSTAAFRQFGLIVLFLFFFTNAQSQEAIQENVIYWDIKAVFPGETLLDLKAIDKDGTHHDVKAIQDSHDISLLSVKALVNGETLPIKMIVRKNDEYYPIKAIDYEGRILDVKAIGKNGEIYDVKGVSRMGSIVEVRAIDKEQNQYNVISISPENRVNHVKGLKMFNEEVEAVIHGVKIFAHVKSLREF